MIINYSTGAIGVPVEKRVAYLRELRPDVAALNMGSMNYAKYSRSRRTFVFDTVFANPFSEIIELLEVMNELGIKPEHECFDLGHIGSLEPLVHMGVLKPPLHVDCVMGVVGGAPPTARNLAAMVDNIPDGQPLGRHRHLAQAVDADQRGARARRLDPRRPGGQLLPARRRDGAVQRRPRRQGARDGRQRGASPGDRRRGARAARPAGARRMSLPLEGVRVLDLSRLLPGPFCSLLLADFGAEVIKVEDMGMGDYARWSPPYYEGAEESARSALFLGLNRNKSSIRLNLKDERGREVLLRLAKDADVVLESFRPGVLDRLGVGYEQLKEVNPGIVYCAITGYGLDGPLRDRSGHDMNYLGLIGLLGLSGEADGPPVQSAGQIADVGGGGADGRVRHPRGAARARHVRGRPGRRRLDGRRRALVAGDDRRELPRRRQRPAPRAHPARRHVRLLPAVRVRGRLGDARCARAEVLQELLRRRRPRGPDRAPVPDSRAANAHAQLEAIFRERTRADWTAFAGEHDCCLEPVLDLGEVLESDLVREREMVVEVEQPGADRPVRQLGVPVKLSRTPGDPRRLPGPGLGEHTQSVLRDAGYTGEEIAALEEDGAIGGLAQGVTGSFLS